MEFIKLKDIQSFTVKEVVKSNFKMWNTETNTMEVSEKPQKGFRKVWQVTTDKGTLDLSDSQMGQMLVGIFDKEKSVLVNSSFDVRTNGKEGKEIRYFLNFKKEDDYSQPEEEINPDNVEF